MPSWTMFYALGQNHAETELFPQHWKQKIIQNVLGGTKISLHCNYKAQAKVQKENDYAVWPNTFVYIIYVCFPPFLPIVIGTVLEVSS